MNIRPCIRNNAKASVRQITFSALVKFHRHPRSVPQIAAVTRNPALCADINGKIRELKWMVGLAGRLIFIKIYTTDWLVRWCLFVFARLGPLSILNQQLSFSPFRREENSLARSPKARNISRRGRKANWRRRVVAVCVSFSPHQSFSRSKFLPRADWRSRTVVKMRI